MDLLIAIVLHYQTSLNFYLNLSILLFSIYSFIGFRKI